MNFNNTVEASIKGRLITEIPEALFIPPDALRMTKKLLREGMISNFETMLEMSANMQALMHLTEDHEEAITAFFEKRDGNFKGK